jgi:hypothetical protein
MQGTPRPDEDRTRGPTSRGPHPPLLVTLTPIPDMPTDSADHVAPPEASALPDAGTRIAPTGGDAVTPTPPAPTPAQPEDAALQPEPEVSASAETPPAEAPGSAETPAAAQTPAPGPAPAPEAPGTPASGTAAPALDRPSSERGSGRDGAAARGQQRRPPRPLSRGRGDGPPVPMPEHHHLPGWVRRAHAKARPELSELLGSLQGPARAEFVARLDELTATISSGKFSMAWQYPEVIASGRTLQERQRSELAEQAKASRHLEGARRRAGDRLRDAAELLTADAASRLQRALRTATDAETIAGVEAEAARALSTARSAHNKRRDREIERTRARIHRTLPRAALEAESPTETWQDVLRRFAEEQSASTGAGG